MRCGHEPQGHHENKSVSPGAAGHQVSRPPPGRLVMGSGPRGGSPSHWPVLYGAKPGPTARSWFLPGFRPGGSALCPASWAPRPLLTPRGRGQFCRDLGCALAGVLLGPLGFSGPHSPPVAGLPPPTDVTVWASGDLGCP